MTNETEQEIEVEQVQEAPETVEVDAPEEKAATETPEAEEAKGFDPKKRVEFSTPEQQAKFNNLYKQVKMSDARNAFQSQVIEKLYERLEALEKTQIQSGAKDAETVLQQRIKSARELGDEDAEAKAINDLVQFKVDSAIKGTQPKPKPVNTVEQLDPDEQYVYGLAIEKDNTGNLLRPWLQDTHPQHQEVLRLAKQYADEYGDDPVVVMQKLDEHMSPKKPQPTKTNTRAPDPLRTNLTVAPNKAKIKVSSKEAEIAKKLGVPLSEYVKYRV